MITSKYKRYAWKILFVTIIVLLAYVPHFQAGIFEGRDNSFHLYRIYSLADAIKNGVFPVKVHALECYGYGYGVGFFYCNFFLYIPAILVACGMPLLTAYKIFVFLIMYSACLSVGYCVWKITNNEESAWLAAVIIMFAARFVNAIYVETALGTMLGFVFVPMAITGMFLFLTRDERPTLLMLGFIGIIFSHTISTFLAFLTCGVLVVIYFGKLIKNIKKLLVLVGAVGVVSMVTACFWVPMLEQLKSQLFKVATPWTTSEQNVQSLEMVIKGKDGVGVFVVGALIIAILGVVVMWKNTEKREQLKNNGVFSFLFIGILFMLVTTYFPFWHFMNSVVGIKILQFPYRLFNPATICIVFAIAGVFSQLKWKTWVKRGIITAAIFVGMYCSFNAYERYYTDITLILDEQIVNGEIAGLGGGEEWLPIETEREDLLTPAIAIDNEGNQIEGYKQKGANEFVFKADLSKSYYDVPYIWYKGYSAQTKAGISLDWDSNEHGLFRIFMPEDGIGVEEVIVSYTGTKWQKLSYAVSLLGTLMFFAFLAVSDLILKEKNKLCKEII